MMEARASLRRGSSLLRSAAVPKVLRSTPFVSSVAAQFAAQLNSQPYQPNVTTAAREVSLQGRFVGERRAKIISEVGNRDRLRLAGANRNEGHSKAVPVGERGASDVTEAL